MFPSAQPVAKEALRLSCALLPQGPELGLLAYRSRFRGPARARPGRLSRLDNLSALFRALDPMITFAEIEGARTVLKLILAALPEIGDQEAQQ